MRLLRFDNPEGPRLLHQGAVGVIPTDTLYGVVASAHSQSATQKVYQLKGRSLHKPCIVLAASIEQIAAFGVPQAELDKVKKYWPGPLSVIFSHIDSHFSYLTRELGLPPFRIPGNKELCDFLAQTGPLIAPSANKQGQPPAKTVAEAFAIFAEQVSFYVDGGHLEGEPSTIVRIKTAGDFAIIRQGKFKLDL